MTTPNPTSPANTGDSADAGGATGPGGAAGAGGVTVLVPGALRSETGGEGRLRVPLSGGGGVTLRAVLDAVAASHPRLARRIRDEQGALRRYVNVYVDGEDCRRLSDQDTPVAAGAEIQVLPSIAGG
jgi:molybdopterin converting factor small subunit